LRRFSFLTNTGASAPTLFGDIDMAVSTDTLKTRAAEYQADIRAGYNFTRRTGVPRNEPLQNLLNFIEGELRYRERAQNRT
jgi:hypothetical protein